MIYWVSYFIIWATGQIFAPRTIIGKGHISGEGGFILASNHKSNLDPVLIGLCFSRRITYMAKDSLFRHPIARFFLNKVEAFPVRRGTADIRALREAIRRLKKGLPLVVFPEGTREGSGKERKIESGIGFLAVKSGVPVVPVCISGSDKVLPPKGKILKRWPVTISFGKPLTFSSEQPYSEIVASIMKEIQALS